MYNVLVTNDDGIEAKGIERLIASLSLITKVYLFAPKVQQSAKGQSMTALHSFSVEKRKYKGTEEAWAVDGTPADCVKFGVQSMTERNIPIDFVVSGINMGLNLGADTHYSGTVSAAMEGALCGYHSIALSVEHHVPDYYDYICSMLPQLLELAKEQDISTVLNVNTPDMPAWQIKGTKITRSGPKRFLDQLVIENPEDGEDAGAHEYIEDNENSEKDEPNRNHAEKDSFMVHYSGGNYPIPDGLDDDIDVVANAAGYATITPINIDYTDRAAYHGLQRITNRDTLCLFIDFQEKLVPAMKKSGQLMKNTVKWARCAEALGFPILLTQQYTRGLGPTVPDLRNAIHEYNKQEKTTFSCYDAPGFAEEMEVMAGKNVIIAGIETHICVYQTAMDYRKHGFNVTILEDCCGARKKSDHESALRELREAGCRVTTFETFVYETMRTSAHAAFKTISAIIKE